jgi:hypothetical protein
MVVIVGWIILAAIPAHAAPPQHLKPGGYLNPWVFTPDKHGGGTIQAEQYTGGNPLAPGGLWNPYVVERDGKELKVRPQYPWGAHEDSGEEE